MHPPVKRGNRNRRNKVVAKVNVRPNNVVMIPIVGTVVARGSKAVAVVDAGAVDVVVAGGATVLTTVVVRPTKTSRSARNRATINPRLFRPATIARNILIRNRWTRNALLLATTVSARRIPSRTKTKAAKTRAARKIPASANSAKNLLMTARPLPSKPTNAASPRNKTKSRSNASKISVATSRAVMNPVVTNAANIHRRDRVAIRKIIVRKISVRRAAAITRRTIVPKVVVNNLTVAATNRATARAVIAVTDAARRRVVVARVTGSN